MDISCSHVGLSVDDIGSLAIEENKIIGGLEYGLTDPFPPQNLYNLIIKNSTLNLINNLTITPAQIETLIENTDFNLTLSPNQPPPVALSFDSGDNIDIKDVSLNLLSPNAFLTTFLQLICYGT